MKILCLVMSLFLAITLIQPASAITADNAVSVGEDFIRAYAQVGTKAIHVTGYKITILKVMENDALYRLYYKVSADIFGDIKQRIVIIEMQKTDASIVNIYASQLTPEETLL